MDFTEWLKPVLESFAKTLQLPAGFAWAAALAVLRERYGRRPMHEAFPLASSGDGIDADREQAEFLERTGDRARFQHPTDWMHHFALVLRTRGRPGLEEHLRGLLSGCQHCTSRLQLGPCSHHVRALRALELVVSMWHPADGLPGQLELDPATGDLVDPYRRVWALSLLGLPMLPQLKQGHIPLRLSAGARAARIERARERFAGLRFTQLAFARFFDSVSTDVGASEVYSSFVSGLGDGSAVLYREDDGRWVCVYV